MVGNPHLAQSVGHRHGDQVGTPLTADSRGVRGQFSFHLSISSSRLVIVGLF